MFKFRLLIVDIRFKLPHSQFISIWRNQTDEILCILVIRSKWNVFIQSEPEWMSRVLNTVREPFKRETAWLAAWVTEGTGRVFSQ